MNTSTTIPNTRVEALSRKLQEVIENDGAGTARATNLLNALLAALEKREREYGC